MDGADIPLDVALSCVLAAAVQGADRRGLLAALRDPEPREPTVRPDGQGPALVFAFPTPDGGPAPEDHGPYAA